MMATMELAPGDTSASHAQPEKGAALKRQAFHKMAAAPSLSNRVMPVLRPSEHGLVVVVGQQLVLGAGQRAIARPLLDVGYPRDQLQPAARRRPATPDLMP